MLPSLIFPWSRSGPPTLFILESPLRKGYAFELVKLAIGFECSKQPFSGQNRNLMIRALSIQAGEPVALICAICDGLHTWQRVRIKKSEFVYSLTIVNTQAFLMIAVVDYDNLRSPRRRARFAYSITKHLCCLRSNEGSVRRPVISWLAGDRSAVRRSMLEKSNWRNTL